MSETSGCQSEAIFHIAMTSLREADSPRFGLDLDHVRRLAESDSPLHPILVQRQTMRVVDGMHRVHAMALRGKSTIAAQWFEGDAWSAFLFAVESNTKHGLLLSREERKQAALRILCSHPEWSDRGIAKMSGLSAKTVRTIRERSTEAGPQPEIRIGFDGRSRPSSTAAGRATAAEVIKRNPKASLREIARQSGISVGTVRDVRRRLAGGLEPVPAEQRERSADERTGDPTAVGRPVTTSVPSYAQQINLLDKLRSDPSFRFSENGRSVLHQLHTQLSSAEEWRRLAPAVPVHGRETVAGMMLACAQNLMDIAQELHRTEDSLAG